MESSMRVGYLMTVFAVSGSMVLLFYQANKHLCNSFMKKIEYEVRGSTKFKAQSKKKVRFAKEVVEVPIMENHEVAKTQEVIGVKKWKHEKKLKHVMPLNRIALYKGIMNDRKGRLDF